MILALLTASDDVPWNIVAWLTFLLWETMTETPLLLCPLHIHTQVALRWNVQLSVCIYVINLPWE